MDDVKNFIESAGGRLRVCRVANVTRQAVLAWEKNNEIPRQHLADLEKLARDARCYRVFMKAACARGNFGKG